MEHRPVPSSASRSRRRRPLATLAAVALLASTLTAVGVAPGFAQDSPSVVISQVYGAGGNSGALLDSDYVELFNRGGAAADLTDLTVQYASATGTGHLGANAGQMVVLSGTIPAGGYHLVKLAGGSNGDPLPPADDTGTINMAAGSGKVALVDGTDGLGCNGGSTPCSDTQLERIIDLVGYGSANFFEGSGAAPSISATTAAFRADSGCTDTDDNSDDFTAAAPAPRNSGTDLNPCGGGDPLGPLPVISQVYGGGGNSGAPLTNDYVEVFNRGDASVDLTGLSIQYASATGTGNLGANSGQLVALSGQLAPGQYHLIGLAGGANGAALPATDDTGTINMAAASGKVALVEGTDGLGCNGGSTPCDADQLDRILDLVGYGGANFFEGAGTAPGLSNTTAAFRADDGCTDTDDNSDDFTAAAPAPRNSGTDLNPCSGGEGDDNDPIVPVCDDLALSRGETGSVTLSASDADGTVTDAAITDGATDGITLVDPVPAEGVGGTFTVALAADDTLGARDYPVQVTFGNDDETPQTASCTATITVTLDVPADVCEIDHAELTAINEIQGDGSATPMPGEFVVTRGVVTADLTSGGESGLPSEQGLRGYFIEAVADDRDDDGQTSEGLFVFDFGGTFAGDIGDLVHVAGTVSEFSGVTQISTGNHAVCDDPGVDVTLPPPAELPLPTPLEDRAVVFEALESMRVVHDELTLVEFFQLERFGEVRLSSAGVLANPTNVVSPHDDDAYAAVVAHNSANNIILDDGRSGQNLDPLPFLEPGDTLRIGDEVSGVPAIMHFGFNNQWRLQPVSIDAFTEAFQEGRTRPRPETPPEVGGSLTVTAFNVLNYFNGDGYFAGDDHETAQGFPTARGAVTPSEFDRQTEKIVDAITRMDADVVGLIEIENDEGERQAAAALVDALNTALGAEVYAYIDTGQIGTDAIKLAYIYQVDTVVPVGDHAILDSSVDPRFNDQRSRPVLAQTFQEIATGESVTVANNHLKSKGSGCGAGDDHPRQGSCNLTRTLAAEAMVDWLASNPTGVEARGNLIVGDLNSYAKEDPIEAIRASGYTDLLDAYATDGQMPYTFTFDATQGYLDHALADPALVTHVTGAAAWNINADEVPAIDYLESCCGVPFNQRFRTEEVATLYYDDSAFRSSDHDPVLVGLDLTGPPCGALPPASKARPCRGDDPPPGHAAKGDRLRR